MDATSKALAKIKAHQKNKSLARPSQNRRSRLKLDDLGITVRSKWEAKYAYYLEMLKSRGDLKWWKYENVEYQFPVKRGTRFYKPDFEVCWWDGIEHAEIKGYMDAKSRTQLKRMRKYHPDVTVNVIGRDWFARMERNGVAGAVPGWPR